MIFQYYWIFKVRNIISGNGLEVLLNICQGTKENKHVHYIEYSTLHYSWIWFNFPMPNKRPHLVSSLINEFYCFCATLDWPLTYDHDLWTWSRYSCTLPTYQISGLYVRLAMRVVTNAHEHTHRMSKLLHPTLARGVTKLCHIWT